MKAALFDLDGVVLDTESQYTVFWGNVFRKYYHDESIAVKIKGSTLVEIYDRYFGDKPELQAEITRGLDEFERNMSYNYIKGFPEYVTLLHEQGVKTAVVTSSNRAKMSAVYEKRPEMRQYFDYILTSEDFSESKPSPDCYQRGAARCGAKPEECVVFEDSFNGLKAGRASGAYVIGLATTNSADAIRPYCDRVIDDYGPLIAEMSSENK